MTEWEKIEEASVDEFGMPVPSIMDVITSKFAPLREQEFMPPYLESDVVFSQGCLEAIVSEQEKVSEGRLTILTSIECERCETWYLVGLTWFDELFCWTCWHEIGYPCPGDWCYHEAS